jgi:hypothetical protein
LALWQVFEASRISVSKDGGYLSGAAYSEHSVGWLLVPVCWTNARLVAAITAMYLVLSPISGHTKWCEDESEKNQALDKHLSLFGPNNGKKFNDIETRLYKLIADNEKKEGFDGKMDRKSLRRILSNLAESGFIKNIRIKLKLGQKTKELLFICDPNIDESHTIIQSAVEQVHVKVL